MVLNKEKRAKLVGTLARCQGASNAAGTSVVAPSPTPSTPIVAIPLAVAQASPAPPPLEEDKGVVEIESDKDSVELPVFKRRRLVMATTSHFSIASRPASLRGQPPSASSPPGLLFLEGGDESALATPSAPELPSVLQHALKGFQTGVMGDSDEARTRERLGLNFGTLLAQSDALISRTEVRVKEQVALAEAKAKEEMALLARAFTTCEIALKQELASLRQAEKDLSKWLHDKSQEAVELEAKILPLRTHAIELEEAAEATKAKMVRLEERSINQEVQLGCAEAELLQQAEEFKKAEAELTEDAADAYAAGF